MDGDPAPATFLGYPGLQGLKGLTKSAVKGIGGPNTRPGDREAPLL